MLSKLQIQLKNLRQLQNSVNKILIGMTIEYYYIISRYTKPTDPGEKKIKKIYSHEKIIATISTS
jgi:hypothetical protein